MGPTRLERFSSMEKGYRSNLLHVASGRNPDIYSILNFCIQIKNGDRSKKQE